MDTTKIQLWINANTYWAMGGTFLLMILIYIFTRLVVARGLIYLTQRTKNKYDDILMQKLRPNRAAWLAPFIILYAFAYLTGQDQPVVEKFALFFILWLSAVSLNGLIDALNQIYESSPSFTGVSIQGYLDIVKILILMVSIIMSVSLLTGESPILLLSGLGALTAVLMLVFHDTIMAVIASIQISAHDLVKEGDWIEIPSYSADGIVVNMSLHTIKIQNWDKTLTVIPTHKLIEVAYKNWRGMQESGGRRIMRSVHIDQTSIKFCEPDMLDRYRKIDLIAEIVGKRQARIESYIQKTDGIDSPLDGPQITNAEIFRAYVEAYLRSHPDIHNPRRMDFLVRELAPSPTGLPVEVYVFTKTTKWRDYERIQAEIFDHLLAAAQYFDLRVFQQPSGSDFAKVLTVN
ncbi:MAG: mechanosensitive ion channel domain-containing protein [Chloroflexota bacterium]